MSGIAFFDFDGTITVHDTFVSFARHAVGSSRLAVGLLGAMPWIAAWKVGLISNSEAKQRLFGLLYKGMDYGEFVKYGESFSKVIDGDVRLSTLKILKRHQAQGDRVVIVSASIGDWIRPWATLHNIGDVIATEVEVGADGRLTGRFKTENCHGKEKVNRIRQDFGDISGVETYGYGDSRGDDDMLGMVSHPNKIIAQ